VEKWKKLKKKGHKEKEKFSSFLLSLSSKFWNLVKMWLECCLKLLSHRFSENPSRKFLAHKEKSDSSVLRASSAVFLGKNLCCSTKWAFFESKYLANWFRSKPFPALEAFVQSHFSRTSMNKSKINCYRSWLTEPYCSYLRSISPDSMLWTTFMSFLNIHNNKTTVRSFESTKYNNVCVIYFPFLHLSIETKKKFEKNWLEHALVKKFIPTFDIYSIHIPTQWEKLVHQRKICSGKNILFVRHFVWSEKKSSFVNLRSENLCKLARNIAHGPAWTLDKR
jgi:hypothetical protein